MNHFNWLDNSQAAPEKVNTTAGVPPLQAATLVLTEKPASMQEQSPMQNGEVNNAVMVQKYPEKCNQMLGWG